MRDISWRKVWALSISMTSTLHETWHFVLLNNDLNMYLLPKYEGESKENIKHLYLYKYKLLRFSFDPPSHILFDMRIFDEIQYKNIFGFGFK